MRHRERCRACASVGATGSVARAVDLAGNSVREDDLVPQHVTPVHTWRRWDPVPSPAVVPRRQFTEGESLMRMVIRSTLGVLPPAYVQLPRVANLAGHDTAPLAYLDANERHVAPPIGSQQLAEWHGRFDAAIGQSAGLPTLDAEFDVAAARVGAFLEPGPSVVVVNPIDPAHPTDLTDPNRTKGQALQPGEYVLHDVDQLDLPYLPDPLSVGASFTALPGAPGSWLQQWEPTDPNAPWYDRRPFRVRIEDGTGAPVYDAPKRLLTVKLPQAEMVTVNLSSYLDEGAQELFGPWMLQRAIFRSLAFRRLAAAQGRNWLLTPWSELTLVHAVEKPLLPPEIHVPVTPDRRAPATSANPSAVLAGVVQNHAKSTGRLDIEAHWSEPIDDVLQDTPSTLDRPRPRARLPASRPKRRCRIDRDDVAGVRQPTTQAPGPPRVPRHEAPLRHLPATTTTTLPRVLPARHHRPA